MYEDRSLTIDELVQLRGVTWCSIQRILSGWKEWPPNWCLSCCCFQPIKTFFNKVITGDEAWCYGYDPEMKQQSRLQVLFHLKKLVKWSHMLKRCWFVANFWPKTMTPVTHPLYSADLAPCYLICFYFPEEKIWKEDVLSGIKEDGFKKCFDQTIGQVR